MYRWIRVIGAHGDHARRCILWLRSSPYVSNYDSHCIPIETQTCYPEIPEGLMPAGFSFFATFQNLEP
jgi:hypothetical protein